MKEKIIVKLHVIDYSQSLRIKLLSKLSKVIEKIDSRISIKFLEANQYWKYPEVTVCFFGLYGDKNINLKKLMVLLDVDYLYIGDDKKDQRDGEAIWSKNTSDLMLINKNVTWAHIYTWDDSIPEHVLDK